ncbi:MAG: hypothetical protein K0S32_2093 [Bacteroidetes bacterium]|jgi:hypothetical protein|nr:hypothetical protein [Bacteroidota bacterium]
MKTTLFLFISSILLSLGVRANNNGIRPSEENSKGAVKDIIVQECSKWDYSALDKKSSSAKVAFRVSQTGEITVEQISSNDKEFRNLIENNLPKVKLSEVNVSGGLFYIDLKHKTL